MRRGPAWMVGAMTAVFCLALVPATAFAGGEVCQQTVDDEAALDTLAMATMFTEQMNTADEDGELPCRFDDYDSPSYNVCFAANPQPLSTMPKWLARVHADDAAATVLEQSGSLHGDVAPSILVRDVERPSPPAWLVEYVEHLRQQQPLSPSIDLCFDGEYEENCHDLPSEAVLITAGFTPPVDRPTTDLELPWSPDEDARSQRPLVDLRVGPSMEHRSPPDRPPPA